jgi:NAD(P)-dependent dehydrogenase (short-subunit alcohol dehydrogenase family)
MEIDNRVALITGAASGIGREVTLQMAQRGAKAIGMVDISDAVSAAADEVNEKIGRKVAIPFKGDTSDSTFRASVFDQIEKQSGRASICVPAAGITRDALALRMDKETGKMRIYPVETFRQVVEVNLIAPVYWALEMIARIAEDRVARGLKRWDPKENIQGTIVFIGSVSSQGNKGQISYASTKAGLEGAAATVMKEAIYYGVRCGVIHPGFTDTPMVRALGEDYINKNVLPYTQLGRLIRPQEIADAICFMVTNSAVSGELWADAGWHPTPG